MGLYRGGSIILIYRTYNCIRSSEWLGATFFGRKVAHWLVMQWNIIVFLMICISVNRYGAVAFPTRVKDAYLHIYVTFMLPLIQLLILYFQYKQIFTLKRAKIAVAVCLLLAILNLLVSKQHNTNI